MFIDGGPQLCCVLNFLSHERAKKTGKFCTKCAGKRVSLGLIHSVCGLLQVAAKPTCPPSLSSPPRFHPRNAPQIVHLLDVAIKLLPHLGREASRGPAERRASKKATQQERRRERESVISPNFEQRPTAQRRRRDAIRATPNQHYLLPGVSCESQAPTGPVKR